MASEKAIRKLSATRSSLREQNTFSFIDLVLNCLQYVPVAKAKTFNTRDIFVRHRLLVLLFVRSVTQALILDGEPLWWFSAWLYRIFALSLAVLPILLSTLPVSVTNCLKQHEKTFTQSQFSRNVTKTFLPCKYPRSVACVLKWMWDTKPDSFIAVACVQKRTIDVNEHGHSGNSDFLESPLLP